MDGTTLALLTTGLLVGAVSGLLGIGGAIVMVPTLMFAFGFSQARAQGTSIGALLPPIGIFAAIASLALWTDFPQDRAVLNLAPRKLDATSRKASYVA
jgi:uncharacterized membrane protein YfcA